MPLRNDRFTFNSVHHSVDYYLLSILEENLNGSLNMSSVHGDVMNMSSAHGDVMNTSSAHGDVSLNSVQFYCSTPIKSLLRNFIFEGKVKIIFL